MNSICSRCGRSFDHVNTHDEAPICVPCSGGEVVSATRVTSETNLFVSTGHCESCGETIRPHWTTCPVCRAPLHRTQTAAVNLFSPSVRVEKEVRHDLLWAGIAMICLATAGLAGIVLSFVRGGMALRSEERMLGFGIIVFAAMVGGGLLGASKKKEGAVAKGVLMGLLGSLGAIFLVMAVIVLIVVCVIIFVIVTCLTAFNQ